MTPRLNPFAADRRAMGAFLTWSQNAAAGVDPILAHLVKVRASILNGCANCINMHTEEARNIGETEQRLYLLSAWREAPVYTDRERALLGWVDALTLVATKGAPDDATYAALAAQFSPEEVVNLTMLINAINGWNRVAVGFGLFNPDAGAAAAKAVAA